MAPLAGSGLVARDAGLASVEPGLRGKTAQTETETKAAMKSEKAIQNMPSSPSAAPRVAAASASASYVAISARHAFLSADASEPSPSGRRV